MLKITLNQGLILLSQVVLMSLGQVAFKLVSKRLGAGSLLHAAVKLPLSTGFWIVCAIYVFIMVYGIWILTFVPLSLAYPFQATTLLIVPWLSRLFFKEPVPPRYWLSLSLIVLGVGLITAR